MGFLAVAAPDSAAAFIIDVSSDLEMVIGPFSVAAAAGGAAVATGRAAAGAAAVGAAAVENDTGMMGRGTAAVAVGAAVAAAAAAAGNVAVGRTATGAAAAVGTGANVVAVAAVTGRPATSIGPAVTGTNVAAGPLPPPPPPPVVRGAVGAKAAPPAVGLTTALARGDAAAAAAAPAPAPTGTKWAAVAAVMLPFRPRIVSVYTVFYE